MNQRVLFLVIALSLTVSGWSLCQAEMMEFQADYEWILPSGDLWSQGTGAECKIIEWYESGVGVAFALGMAQWEADDASRTIVPWNGSIGRWERWQGDAQMIPIGLSLMIRSEDAMDEDTTLDVQLEAGFRYLMADSSLSLEERQDVLAGIGGPRESVYTSYGAELDDSWVGRVGVNCAWKWDYRTDLLTNIGYQFNLNKGQVKAGSVQQEVDMSGFIMQVGIGFHF